MFDLYEQSELYEKAEELINLGLSDEALMLLERHRGIIIYDADIEYLYYRIYAERSENEKAIEHLNNGLAIDSTHVDCLLGLFYTYAQKNEWKKAAYYLMRAKKAHPDNDLVLSSLIWYYAEINKPEKALLYFEKALKLKTDNPETYYNAAIAYDKIGDFDKVEKCCKKALQFNPHFEDARDLLADNYMMQGQVEKSIDLYNEYLILSPKNIRTLSKLVYYHAQSGNFQRAIASAQEIITMYPNSAVGYVDLAYVQLNCDRLDEAIKNAEKAIDISPADAEAYRITGIIYSEKNNDKQAQRMFIRALQLDPNNVEILRDYYHHLKMAGHYKKMLDVVRKAIRLEKPFCIEEYCFLADYYRENGQYAKAFRFLRKAYKCSPFKMEMIPPIVDLLLERGRLRSAMPFLLRYVESNGWNEVMNQFARHKRFKKKEEKEALLFLRYFGQKYGDFNRYIFLLYAKKFVFVGLALLCPFITLIGFIFWGAIGVIGSFIIYCATLAGWGATKLIKRIWQTQLQKK